MAAKSSRAAPIGSAADRRPRGARAGPGGARPDASLPTASAPPRTSTLRSSPSTRGGGSRPEVGEVARGRPRTRRRHRAAWRGTSPPAGARWTASGSARRGSGGSSAPRRPRWARPRLADQVYGELRVVVRRV